MEGFAANNPRLAIYVVYDDGQGVIDTSSITTDTLESLGTEALLNSAQYPTGTQVDLQPQLPNGPYLVSISTGDVFQVFRLYSDHQLAFTETVVDNGQDGFISLPASIQVTLFSSFLL